MEKQQNKTPVIFVVAALALIAVVAGATIMAQNQQDENNTVVVQQSKSTSPRIAQLEDEDTGPVPQLDVPYVPTPPQVVDKMLELTKVGQGDVLYDLGCGDGRIVITAAKRYGIEGVGVDIDPERIRESKQNAQEAGVADQVQFFQRDLFKTDISEATVLTLYLLPAINLKLRPKIFDELKPGTRIVSHAFDMGDWKPDQTVEVRDGDAGYSRTVHYWLLPANVAGTWQMNMGAAAGAPQASLQLQQKFQEVSGTVTVNGKTSPLTDVQLQGDQLSFTAPIEMEGRQMNVKVTSRVDGNAMTGQAGEGDNRSEWRATRAEENPPRIDGGGATEAEPV